MPEQILRKMPVRALHEYIEAYGIAKDMPPVEKSDLISTILEAELTEYSEEVRNCIYSSVDNRSFDKAPLDSEIGSRSLSRSERMGST